MQVTEYKIGDIVKMKKKHPCGSCDWEITRTGVDFALKCCGCARVVMIARVKFERAVKGLVQRKDA